MMPNNELDRSIEHQDEAGISPVRLTRTLDIIG